MAVDVNIDNQSDYWNRVASIKTFTHPLDEIFLNLYVNKDSAILDFGCGYGRVVELLLNIGYQNVMGVDSSIELIERGRKEKGLALVHITEPLDLPIPDSSVDCILLFAVLTCIPSNKGQEALLDLLKTKLKFGGIIYISDYYIQDSSAEVGRYGYLNGDKNNYGVFSLPEGASFRHHTREWISQLTSGFKVVVENPIVVTTMNGHRANGFQLIAQKI